MKKGLMIFTGAAVVVLLSLRVSIAGSYEVIGGKELQTMMKETKYLVVVDVREPELFSAAHIPGAINIPFDSAKKRVLKELSPADSIVFVCHGGPMGDDLAAILIRNGYKKVYNLKGGMRWWRGPVTK